MTTPSSTPSTSNGILGGLTRVLNSMLATAGLPLTQKFVAHVIAVTASGTAVALLPLGISTELNALIVLASGLIAHWVAPSAPLG